MACSISRAIHLLPSSVNSNRWEREVKSPFCLDGHLMGFPSCFAILSGPILAGFIGSHTSLSLLEHGYNVTIIDNLDNSFQLAVDRVTELAGDKASNLKFVKGDLRDFNTLDRIFSRNK